MRFKELTVGQHFVYKNNQYIKVENLKWALIIFESTTLYEDINAINLESGSNCKFDDNDTVELVFKKGCGNNQSKTNL